MGVYSRGRLKEGAFIEKSPKKRGVYSRGAFNRSITVVVFHLVNAGRVSSFASFEAVEYGGFVKRLFIYIL